MQDRLRYLILAVIDMYPDEMIGSTALHGLVYLTLPIVDTDEFGVVYRFDTRQQGDLYSADVYYDVCQLEGLGFVRSSRLYDENLGGYRIYYSISEMGREVYEHNLTQTERDAITNAVQRITAIGDWNNDKTLHKILRHAYEFNLMYKGG